MFMIRLRIPGGLRKAAQWRQLDDIADDVCQPFAARDDARDVPVSWRHQVEPQAHDAGDQCRAARHDGGVRRRQLAASWRSPIPTCRRCTSAAYELAQRVSNHMLPKTGAYHEIWLDGEQVDRQRAATAKKEEEPIYGPHYLPRKFKIVFAVPPSNDVDVFAHDLRLHRHRRERQARRLECHRRRRHGHDARRARKHFRARPTCWGSARMTR